MASPAAPVVTEFFTKNDFIFAGSEYSAAHNQWRGGWGIPPPNNSTFRFSIFSGRFFWFLIFFFKTTDIITTWIELRKPQLQHNAQTQNRTTQEKG